MTDQLEHLFADLRADAITEVRPPGTDAVRHTVRRRRRTRQVTVAAAVLAIAGGVGWSGYAGGDRTPPAAVPPVTGASLMDDAHAALEPAAPGKVLMQGYGLQSSPERSTAVRGSGDDDVTLQPGAYQLYATCVTKVSGMLLADVTTPGHPDEPLVVKWVPCGTSAEVTTIGFRMLKPGLLSITMSANITAGGEAGYAYRVVRDPESNGPSKTAEGNATRARNRLLVDHPGRFVRTYTSDTDLSGWEEEIYGETRYLRLTCAGPGTVRVTARWLGLDAWSVDPGTGPELASGSLQCDADGTTVMKLRLTLPFSGGWVSVELQPDAVARNKAGFATAIDAS